MKKTLLALICGAGIVLNGFLGCSQPNNLENELTKSYTGFFKALNKKNYTEIEKYTDRNVFEQLKKVNINKKISVGTPKIYTYETTKRMEKNSIYMFKNANGKYFQYSSPNYTPQKGDSLAISNRIAIVIFRDNKIIEIP